MQTPTNTRYGVRTAKKQVREVDAKTQTVEDLLPATLRQEAATRPRSVRVNTLLLTVEDALAWLADPPPEHARFAAQVIYPSSF